MEFNKIAGAIIGTLLLMMVIGKIGNTLVPEFHPPKDKPGTEGPATTQPETTPDKPVAELLATADAAAGEKRARNACVACHTFEKGRRNGTGPNLYDIVGRKRGSHAGYAYSDGLKNAGGEWTYEDLFKYLAGPARMIQGSKMSFSISGAEQRAQVIAYLRTLSESPKPLPAAEKKTDAPKPDEKKAEPPKAAEPPKPATPPAEEKKN